MLTTVEHARLQHNLMIAKVHDIIRGMRNDVKMLEQIINELSVLQEKHRGSPKKRPPT